MLGSSLLVAVSLMSVRFDATNAVSVPSSAALALDTLSLEATFRLHHVPAASEDIWIIANGWPALYGIGVNHNGGDPTKTYIEFYYRFRLNGSVTYEAITYAEFTPIAGKWYSAAFTVEPTGNLVGYLASRRFKGTAGDSSYTVMVTQAVQSVGSTAGSDSPLFIGAGDASTLNRVDVDEVRMTGSVLSAGTLDSRLSYRLTATEAAACVAYWPCDDGGDNIGGAVADASGNGHDGTWQGNALWSDDPDDLYYRVGQLTGSAIGVPLGEAQYSAVTFTGAGGEDSAYPASLLRSPLQANAMRSVNVASEGQVVRFIGRRGPVGAVSIVGHNLTSAADITIEANDSDSWGSPAASESVLYHPSRIIHVLSRPYDYAYWRVRVSDTANPATYLSLGTVQLWQLVEVPDGIPIGSLTESMVDPSTAAVSPHGDRTPRDMGMSRAIGVGWDGMWMGRARRLLDVFEDLGAGAPTLLLAHPALCLYGASVYGTVTALPKLGNLNPSGLFVSVSGLQVTADRPLSTALTAPVAP